MDGIWFGAGADDYVDRKAERHGGGIAGKEEMGLYVVSVVGPSPVYGKGKMMSTSSTIFLSRTRATIKNR